MSASAANPANPDNNLRVNNLALAFQEVFTIVLRTRFEGNPWRSLNEMRASLLQRIVASAQSVRSLGYSDEATQMALYAITGFVDESVLTSRDPIFANWAAQTLQQEMFGNQIAGEIFFRHVADLLNRPDSSEIADVLELHGLCLLLGFRGRYTTGGTSEIDTIIRRIREKIIHIRGPFSLVRAAETPVVPKVSTADPWVRKLSIAALVAAGLGLLFYLGYLVLLSQGTPPAIAAATQIDPMHLVAESAL